MSIYKVKAYDKNKDYSEEIEKAIKSGDYATAAKNEKLRNAKIDGEKLGYEKTYDYIDLGTDIQDAMKSGASGEYVRDLANKRENKFTYFLY